MKAIRKLTPNDIEVKVKQVTEKGATLLLYKTARVDREILDDVFTPLGWQSDYKTIKDNLYCGIGAQTESGEWVWKWDCGIQSRPDGEGNEKKGEASDAFKRAGFQWGIGVELYSAPFIFASVETDSLKDKDGKPIKDSNGRIRWFLKDGFVRFKVSHIKYDELGDISELAISEKKYGNVFVMKGK